MGDGPGRATKASRPATDLSDATDAGKPSVGADERGARGPPWRLRHALFYSTTHQKAIQKQRGPSRGELRLPDSNRAQRKGYFR